MKKERMSFLVASSIAIGVLCGFWNALASVTGLIGWAGFAGCTTYFASGEEGLGKLKEALITNVAGVGFGMLIIVLCNAFPGVAMGSTITGFITFVVCALAYFKLLKFTPGIFIGCFSTFAGGGDWKLLLPSIILGVILGWLCAITGELLYKVVNGGINEDK